MKGKILFLLAFLSHPIFLPLLLNLPAWELMHLLSAVAIALILPVLFFSLKGFDLNSPKLNERQIIYYVLSVCYTLLFIWSYADKAIPLSFGLVHWTLALLALGFLIRKTGWNISWHAMGWGLSTLFIKQELDVLLYVAGIQNLGSWELSLALSLLLGVLVMLVRYLQKAHSVKELAWGYVLGLAVSIFVPYLFQWSSIA